MDKRIELVRTIIESPFAGNVVRNLRYVRACMRDAFMRGEAPFASHALYTQEGVLDDNHPEERELGIWGGFMYREVCPRSAFYLDYGMSGGMQHGFDHALKHHVEIVLRGFLEGAHNPAVSLKWDLTKSADPVYHVWVPCVDRSLMGRGDSVFAAFDDLRSKHYPRALRG